MGTTAVYDCKVLLFRAVWGSRYNKWGMDGTSEEGLRDICLLENVYTNSGDQPASCSVGTEDKVA